MADYLDITETGPQTYRQLQEQNDLSKIPVTDAIDMIYGYKSASDPNRVSGVENYTNVDLNDWGESRYDKPYVTGDEINHLGDIRANEQSNFAKIANGTAKGAVLAGTTFANGTVGVLAGIAGMIDTGVHGKNEGESTGDFFSRVAAQYWNNPFAQAMQSINEWSERAMPNYYSEEELYGPWYENIFTANFLGDKFIKNLGFTVGAYFSGGVYTKGLQALKIPQYIEAVTGSTGAAKAITSFVGASMSAASEASFEALNNSKDWLDAETAQLKDEFQNEMIRLQEQYEASKGKNFIRVPDGTEGGNVLVDKAYYDYQNSVNQLNKDYEEALARIQTNAYKMGNADFIMNIPILVASNLFEFGKMYANGYRTGRRALKLTGVPGEYAAKTTIKRGVLKGFGNAASEAAEEGEQGIANRIAGNYYSKDVDNFIKSKIDPTAEQETLSWINAATQGFTEYLSDPSNYEEMFIGALTGALGMPSFRSVRNSKGRIQSPITLQGGIIGEIREAREQRRMEEELADRLNKRVQSPEFVNYYQGLIRHRKYQNDMNDAVERGDEFDFKNAEYAQFISDINMFDNAGKLEDLKDLITESFDVSDENLQSIVENTTSKTKDASEKEVSVGPFIDRNGNPMYSTPEGKQEMIDKLTKTKDEMLSEIESYNKIKNEIDSWSNQALSNEQLEELTWLKSQIKNWQERSFTLAGEVKPTITNLLENINQIIIRDEQFLFKEGQKSGDLTEAYRKADEEVIKLKRIRENLETLRGFNDKVLAATIASDNRIAEDLKTLFSSNFLEYTEDEAQTLSNKIDDIVKLANARDYYNKKLKEYMQNPGTLQEDINKAKESVAEEEENKQKATLKDDLKASKDVIEFRKKFSNIEEGAQKDALLDELEKEDFEPAKSFKNMRKYRSEVLAAIQKTVPADKQKAVLDAFDSNFGSAQSLETLADPNSYTGTGEETDIDFLTTQYYLLSAIQKANNSNNFKDTFSKSYKEFTINPIPKSEEASTTSTTKPSDTNPIGDTTSESISEENKETANNTITESSSPGTKRPFYRPVIPELHILESKKGDFRPMNVVVREKEGKDFDYIYNFLKEQGAFEYINSGKLKQGAKIKFKVVAEFEKGKPDSWKNPTIFMIDASTGQIVGSLDEAQSQLDSFEGLTNLVTKIREEWNKTDKSKDYIPDNYTTTVAKVMNGKVPYGDEEKSLKNIPNVRSEGRKLVFGIIKNGVLRSKENIKIRTPKDISNKEGRMYLLVSNADGYTPVAVRVKHFNTNEYNPNDVSLDEAKRMQEIKSVISKLAEVTDADQLKGVVSELADVLFTGNLSINYANTKAGPVLEFKKFKRDENGAYIKDAKGNRIEESFVVYLNKKKEGGEGEILGAVGENGLIPRTTIEDVRKDSKDVIKEITEGLLKFNLPLQVSINKLIETSYYADELVDSDMLTSNITDAAPKGAWFVTNYIDDSGKEHKATVPAIPGKTITTSNTVGGTESVAKGIKITTKGGDFYVDLDTNIIYYSDGKPANNHLGKRVSQLIIDVVTANKLFGNNRNGTNLIDNKWITPEGKVLDRDKKKYLDTKEAEKVKAKLNAAKRKQIDKVDEVLHKINENQSKVDKARTDGEHYYVLEEDGQYHAYDRVHKKIGSNWKTVDQVEDTLKDVKRRLEEHKDKDDFDNYISFLEGKYNIDLKQFKGKDADKSSKAFDTILNIVRDSIIGTKSQQSLNGGQAVDTVVREFFNNNGIISELNRPENMSPEAFNQLIDSLNRIKEQIDAVGLTFYANNIVLFYKYPDGTRVAGELDILATDEAGKFHIFDLKTSKYSFGTFTGYDGRQLNYFENKSSNQTMSQKDYYTLQLSAYKNLFENQYGVPITTLRLLPFVLTYDKNGNVTHIKNEHSIALTYNPAVRVPKVGVTTSTTTNSNTTQMPEKVKQELSTDVNKPLQANFIIDGKIEIGEVYSIGSIGGVDLYVTRKEVRSKGFGKDMILYDYYTIFPNGETFKNASNVSSEVSIDEMKQNIKDNLKDSADRVKEISSETTSLTLSGKPIILSETNSIEETTDITPTNDISTELSASARTIQKEQAVNVHDDEFEDECTLERRADEKPIQILDREKELAWLDKVLPQLSKEDRVKFVKGLINVARKGAKAWGQFDGSVIILSDIAAEGTTYHEAFHVVFNMLLDENERQDLLKEAKKLYGTKDDISLEEDLAEGFREYVMSRDATNIFKKIKNFFEDLYIKVSNWAGFGPHIKAYYLAVNEGNYSKNSLPVKSLKDIKFRTVAENTQFLELSNKIQKIEDYITGMINKYGANDVKSLKKKLENPHEGIKIKWETINKKKVAFLANEFGQKEDLIYESAAEQYIADSPKLKGIAFASSYLGRGYIEFENRGNIKKDLRNLIHNLSELSHFKSELNKLNARDGFTGSLFSDEELNAIQNNFDSLTQEQKDLLTNKGWTKEQFDSISQEERKQALNCISL